MREGINFYYRGIYSLDMGLVNVNINGSSLFEEPFIANRTIHEIKVKGRDKPYFQGVEYEPLSFTLSFYFVDNYNERRIREVARWLTPSYYEPFYTDDNPERIFYCMPVEESTLIHNGLKEGYLTLTMRCDSPYSYSPVVTSPVYDFSNNTSTGTIFTFENLGDVPVKPEMWITKVGKGDLSIVNITDANREFKFVNLADGETVYVDNENEIIETDIFMTYRYDNFNDNYLRFVYGINKLVAYGKFKMILRYQFKTLQG